MVSEELNSVETDTSLDYASQKYLFQKNLIVWKHLKYRLDNDAFEIVSEELNSVETV